MPVSDSNALPPAIQKDLNLAKKIYEGLEKGDKTILKEILDLNPYFTVFAEKYVYNGLPAEDVVQDFWTAILLKGNVFKTYQAKYNCSLKSYLTFALKKFIYTKNKLYKAGPGIEIPTGEHIDDINQPEPERKIAKGDSVDKLWERARQKEIRKYVNELIFTGITRCAQYIHIKLSDAGPAIHLHFAGSSQAYEIPLPVGDPSAIFYRSKLIGGLDLAESPIARKSSPIAWETSEGRKISLIVSTNPGQDGEEIYIHMLENGHGQNVALPEGSLINVDDPPDSFPNPGTSEERDGDELKALTMQKELASVMCGEFPDEAIEPKIPRIQHISSLVEILEKQEYTSFCAKVVREALDRLTSTHPDDARLIRCRMDDIEFTAIAILFETNEKSRASMQEAYDFLKKREKTSIASVSARKRGKSLLDKKTDLWKHRYERPDGPSALFRFAVLLERLLVERNVCIDTSSESIAIPPQEDAFLNDLLQDAINRLQVTDRPSATTAEIQLSVMRATEKSLLLGTIDGRKITEDKDEKKSPELKKLQKSLEIILDEKRMELTIVGGRPRIVAKKEKESVPSTSADPTDNLEETQTILKRKTGQKKPRKNTK